MRDMINRLTAEAVELLKEMISIPSPSFEEDAVCGYVCKWLTDHGVEHRRVGNNIIAEHIADPTRPTLMLCAHMDTVSPCEGYGFDPYSPDYETAAEVIGRISGQKVRPEEIVAGLGSNDDGASVVSMIAAFRYFMAGRIPFFQRYMVLWQRFPKQPLPLLRSGSLPLRPGG